MSHHLSAVVQRGIRGVDGKTSEGGFIRSQCCFKILNEDVTGDWSSLSPPGLLHFANRVRACGKLCEHIDPTFCLRIDGPAAVQVDIRCHLSTHKRAATVKQLNSPAIQWRFTRVANTVTIQIVPFLTTNCSCVHYSG